MRGTGIHWQENIKCLINYLGWAYLGQFHTKTKQKPPRRWAWEEDSHLQKSNGVPYVKGRKKEQ